MCVCRCVCVGTITSEAKRLQSQTNRATLHAVKIFLTAAQLYEKSHLNKLKTSSDYLEDHSCLRELLPFYSLLEGVGHFDRNFR